MALTENIPLLAAVFAGVTSLFMMLALLLRRPATSVDDRLMEAAPSGGRAAAPPTSANPANQRLSKIGNMLMPQDESRLARLKSRLQQAGLYRQHATAVYLGVKFVLMISPIFVGLLIAAAGLLTITQAIVAGTCVGLLASLASSAYLAQLTKERQVRIRRALPDALDVIVVCLEGGLSLPAAFDRVATELREAHPLLSTEMAIVRREVQLGRSTGAALRQFADRFDVEEIRSLASVIIQAERFGASIVQALRVHAEALRIKRYQHAEAQAQKAPVKLIFPTVLCIFPALYIVLMGPAAVRLLDMLDKFGK
jgi:tight adherence protein C